MLPLERFESPGDLTGVLTVLDALQRRSWVARAACRDTELQWIPEVTGGAERASAVVPLLEICAICPVRPECLRDAFDDGGSEVVGVFGGTTQLERRTARTAIGPANSDAWRLRDPHAVSKIVDAFEATFDERLASWRDRLAEHRLSLRRFVQGGRGGPGRGHLGKASKYAARHGVSRSTAWRRLKANREARARRVPGLNGPAVAVP